jgi:uncharacterized membrane protein YecN with MAPEG domain
MLLITSLYASILAMLVIFLAYKVVDFRRTKSVGIGDNGDKGGLRAIRVHANAVEYIPMMVILMGIYEINGGSTLVLHIIGAIAVVSRLLHATGLSKSAGTTFGRFVGTLLTWMITLVLAGINIYQFVISV